MLKMAVGKHHAASNNITNSMDKNVTYNHSFHFTAFYPMGPVAMLQLRWIWARRKTTFFTIGSGMSEWKVIEGSGLKRNDRVILKFAFDIHFYAFRCWYWRNLLKLTNFGNWQKLWTGCAPWFFEKFAFSMLASYSATQNAVYWMVRARNFEKSVKTGQPNVQIIASKRSYAK